MGHAKHRVKREADTEVGCQIRTNGDERRVHTNFQAARTEGNDTRHYSGIRNLSPTNKILDSQDHNDAG